MKQITIFPILLLLFISAPHAQDVIMKVKLNNGTTDTIRIADINKITFRLDPASNIKVSNIKDAEHFKLHLNYPNPFNPSTVIEFSIPRAGAVRLHIYDIRGKRIRTFEKSSQQAGRQHFEWDGRNDEGEIVASGVYIYSLTFEEHVRSGSMIFLK